LISATLLFVVLQLDCLVLWYSSDVFHNSSSPDERPRFYKNMLLGLLYDYIGKIFT